MLLNEVVIIRGSADHDAYVAKKNELEAKMREIITGDPNQQYTFQQSEQALKDPKRRAAYDQVKSEFDALWQNTTIKNAPRPVKDNGTAGRYPDARPGKRYMGD